MIRLIYPDDLEEPFEFPGGGFPQSVFIFKGKSIVSKTRNGWAIHKWDGNILKEFSYTNKITGWWNEPVLENGEYRVFMGTGPGGISFKLDIISGKMIQQNNE